MATGRSVDFSEGRSLDYLIPAAFVGIGAIGCLSASLYVYSALLVVLCTAMLLVESGVEVDLETARIRSYKGLWKLRFGSWSTLEVNGFAELVYVNDAAIMRSRGVEGTVRAKSFTLELDTGNKQKKIHEFTDYKLARHVVSFLRKRFDYTIHDQYAEKRKRAYTSAQNRKSRK